MHTRRYFSLANLPRAMSSAPSDSAATVSAPTSAPAAGLSSASASWSAAVAAVPGSNAPVSVEAYSPEWSSRYLDESERIRGAFGSNLVRTLHVGSTSVPGCAAKPVIDIVVLVHDWEATWSTQLEDDLRALDYHAYPRAHPFTKIKRRYWQRVIRDAEGNEKHVAHLHGRRQRTRNNRCDCAPLRRARCSSPFLSLLLLCAQ